MEHFINWEYYNSHFPKVSEEEFDKLLPRAEIKVNVWTHNRSCEAVGYKLEQVKAAVANIINALAEQEKVKEHTGINSVSNDGYSESYSQISVEQMEESLKNVCFDWLSGTGLTGCL